MRYFGGKHRIAPVLAEFLTSEMERLKLDTFLDAFCGSCSVVSRIPATYTRVANDGNVGLVRLLQAVRDGRTEEFPDHVTEEEYQRLKGDVDTALGAFVGIGCSYAGKLWGGYARSGARNYASNAKNSLLKLAPKIQGVQFFNCDYKHLIIHPPCRALVYCDIPYSGRTNPYRLAFDIKEFSDWALRLNNDAIRFCVSDYSGSPLLGMGWKCSRIFTSKQDIRSKTGRERTLECVYTPKS